MYLQNKYTLQLMVDIATTINNSEYAYPRIIVFEDYSHGSKCIEITEDT